MVHLGLNLTHLGQGVVPLGQEIPFLSQDFTFLTYRFVLGWVPFPNRCLLVIISKHAFIHSYSLFSKQLQYFKKEVTVIVIFFNRRPANVYKIYNDGMEISKKDVQYYKTLHLFRFDN